MSIKQYFILYKEKSFIKLIISIENFCFLVKVISCHCYVNKIFVEKFFLLCTYKNVPHVKLLRFHCHK